MKIKIPHWLIIVFFCLNLVQVMAATNLADLYTGQVPVASRSQAQWQQAVNTAWLQVLTKVSGNQAIVKNPAIQAAAGQASQYVRSYAYQTSANNQLMLRVRFDNSQVNNILHANNQPVWSSQRPLTLVWLAYGDASGAYQLLDADSTSSLLTAFKENAFDLGLPLVFPVMDLVDLGKISPQAVASLDPVAINQASQRYQADDVLSGRLWQNYQGKWIGNWMLMNKNKFQSWQTSGDTQAANIKAVLGNLAENLAGQYASPDDNSNGGEKVTLTLRVENVDGLNDYADVVQYLRNLSPVTRVNVSEVDGQVLVLTVDVIGGVNALNAVLMNGKKLYPDDTNDDNNDNKDSNLLTYSWGVKPQSQMTGYQPSLNDEVPTWQSN